NVSLVANFDTSAVIISALPIPSTGGSIEGDGNYSFGSMVSLIANAGTGYHFLNWMENGAIVSIDSIYTFFANQNRNLYANFDTLFVNIQTYSDPSFGGIATGGGAFLQGASVTLTATPAPKFVFEKWTLNGVIVSSQPVFTFPATVSGNYIAHFADYRDPVVGTYSGTRESGYWSNSNPIGYDTTYAYSFQVLKHPNSSDSIIVDGVTYPIDSTFYYYSSPYPGIIHELKFPSDSCIVYDYSGGLGGGSYTRKKGRKL
ncbi:MAG: InlB B-repeat-containing protein, partial [Bacteroidota bacterium]